MTTRKEFKPDKYKSHEIRICQYTTVSGKNETKADVIDLIAKEHVNMKMWDKHISKTEAYMWAKNWIDADRNKKLSAQKTTKTPTVTKTATKTEVSKPKVTKKAGIKAITAGVLADIKNAFPGCTIHKSHEIYAEHSRIVVSGSYSKGIATIEQTRNFESKMKSKYPGISTHINYECMSDDDWFTPGAIIKWDINIQTKEFWNKKK